jgi:hypothetical protein
MQQRNSHEMKRQANCLRDSQHDQHAIDPLDALWAWADFEPLMYGPHSPILLHTAPVA